MKFDNAYSYDLPLVLLTCVKFFDEIFSVLDGDLMGVTVQAIHHRYHILFFAFYPPAVKM